MKILAALLVFSAFFGDSLLGDFFAQGSASEASETASASSTPAASQPANDQAGAPANAQATVQSGAQTNVKDTAPGSAATPPSIAAADKSPACLTDPVAIEDLKKRREELEAAQKELASRDTELKAREKALNDELKKLEDIRQELARTEEARTRENDEKVAKLVSTVESMSPKAAAKMLANMDETLAVAAMGRMSTERLAKLMNLMEPEKSARLTETLAGVVRAKKTASNGAAATTVSLK